MFGSNVDEDASKSLQDHKGLFPITGCGRRKTNVIGWTARGGVVRDGCPNNVLFEPSGNLALVFLDSVIFESILES